MFVSLGKALVLLFVAVLLLFSFKVYSASNCSKVIDISLISLLALPEKYEGTCVRLRGVLFVDDRRGRLFFNKESLDNNVLSNSILLVFKDSEKYREFDRGYTTVIGLYKYNAIEEVYELSY